MNDLVKGGQDKSAQEITESSFWCGACMVVFVVLALLACAAYHQSEDPRTPQLHHYLEQRM
jgi:hypothetical protein